MTEILLSPFSNNALRDWPLAHYAALAKLLLDRGDAATSITIVGTRGQRAAAAGIVRDLPPEHAVNACGRWPWREVVRRIAAAGCLIGNNSGLVHLGRQLGVPTVCIFGGSHQRTEWGPIGPTALILSRAIGCSPCQRNHLWECPYGVACLRDIDPEDVAAAAATAMARARIEATPDHPGNSSAERMAPTC